MKRLLSLVLTVALMFAAAFPAQAAGLPVATKTDLLALDPNSPAKSFPDLASPYADCFQLRDSDFYSFCLPSPMTDIQTYNWLLAKSMLLNFVPAFAGDNYGWQDAECDVEFWKTDDTNYLKSILCRNSVYAGGLTKENAFDNPVGVNDGHIVGFGFNFPYPESAQIPDSIGIYTADILGVIPSFYRSPYDPNMLDEGTTEELSQWIVDGLENGNLPTVNITIAEDVYGFKTISSIEKAKAT